MREDIEAELAEEIRRVSELFAPISLDEVYRWSDVELTADTALHEFDPTGGSPESIHGSRLAQPPQTEAIDDGARAEIPAGPSAMPSGWPGPDRSRRWLILAGAAASVLFVVLLVTFLSSRDDENDTIFTDDVDQERAPVVEEKRPPPAPDSTVREPGGAEFEAGEVTADTTPLGIVFQATTPSSLGDIAWTVLEGAPDLVPFEIVETDDGYAAVTTGGSLLVSLDGGSWIEVPTPSTGELRALERQGDRYVLEVIDEGGLTQFWETNDFDTWRQGAGPPPEVLDTATGLGAATRLFSSSRAESQGSTLTFWDGFVSLDWRPIALQLVDEGQRGRVEDLFVVGEIDYASAVIDLQGYVDEREAFGGGDPDELVGRLNFVATETRDRWTIDMSDAATGEPVGSIEGSLGGTTFEEAFDRLRSGFSEQHLALETEDGLEIVDVPWDNPDNGADFIGTDDGFTAVRRIGDYESPFRMEVWASSNGRDWQNVALVNSDEIGDINSFAEHDGVMIVTFGHTDEVSRYVILRSEDGISWAPPSVPPIPTWENFDDGFGNTLHNATGNAYGLPAGWVWLSGMETDFGMWTSSDGDLWEQVDVSGIPAPWWAQLLDPEASGGGYGRQWVSRNSLFIRENRELETRQQPSKLWIISIPG